MIGVVVDSGVTGRRQRSYDGDDSRTSASRTIGC